MTDLEERQIYAVTHSCEKKAQGPPPDEFRWCDPNKYHPTTVKLIMISGGFYAVAHLSVYEIRNPQFSIWRIRETMERYIQRQKERNFEYRGTWVEIHYNSVYNRFFWVTGKDPERFSGACEYFISRELAIQDVKREIDYTENFKEGYCS